MTKLTTPADLKAMRMLLGMSQGEAGRLLNVSSGEIGNLESMKTYFVYSAHITLLDDFIAKVNDELVARLKGGVPPEFLFTYSNDEDFAKLAPEREKWFRFASMHQMFTARLLDEWRKVGHKPTIVGIPPQSYGGYLSSIAHEKNQSKQEVSSAEIEALDSDDNRIAWARVHLKAIQSRPGAPHKRQRFFKA